MNQSAAPSIDDDVALEGTIALEGVEELTVHVALVVGSGTLEEARIPEGELTLLLDDGGKVKVERDARTRVEALPTKSIRGRWEVLETHAEARRFASRAPGPHVRAELRRRVLRPGVRVTVRGAVLARGRVEAGGDAAGYREPGASVTVTHVLAREIAPVAKVRSDRRAFALPFARIIGGVALVVAGLLFTRWVVTWPASLAHPSLAALRAATGTVTSFYASLGVLLLLPRLGGFARLLPRFVREDGEDHLDAQAGSAMLLVGVLLSLMMGIGGASILERVWETGDLKVRGPKGPLVPGSIVPATFMHLAIVAAWVGLWLRERREARLADLFRDRGSGWKVRSGRIESGSLVLLASTSGHGRSTTTFLRGQVEAPLTIRSGEDSLRVEPDKLVFGLDTTIPAKHKPREVRWETAPGAPAAVAGRFDGKSYLRASGPESLLVET
ncbi:MAG TPA: hypothetical protein VM580_32915, partial [Labilithrix sp.]|nr:hypothetical protein [Labilithrix sp.]